MSKWGFAREKNVADVEEESAIDCEAAGKRKVRIVVLLEPAFMAAVAYVDPGNIAANVTTGVHYDYLPVWVLTLVNLMTVLV